MYAHIEICTTVYEHIGTSIIMYAYVETCTCILYKYIRMRIIVYAPIKT